MIKKSQDGICFFAVMNETLYRRAHSNPQVLRSQNGMHSLGVRETYKDELVSQHQAPTRIPFRQQNVVLNSRTR